MAKGDYVKIRSEIGGKLETDEIRVTQDGGKLEVDWSQRAKGIVEVLLKGRTDKVKTRFTFALIAVRTVEAVIAEDEG